MLFSSLLFLFFFLPGVLIIYYGILRKRKSRNNFLLFASLVFYAWGEPFYVCLMIGCILGNYICALLINRYRSKRRKSLCILGGMLFFNLGILAVFKYLGFIIENLNQVFHSNLNAPSLMLPIGISFFTFQGISYVVDVYRQKGEVLRNPLDLGLYIAFFPQLVAGPIVRYETIAKEIHGREENQSDFASGIERFIVGFGKKVILSNNFALIADKAFGLDANNISVTFAWLGAIAYALQIYFDFGGYSDMAIGLGRMFGFHFNENFNVPYVAKSISDFWRRWHVSLGTWFRDYVYFPLGGSRVERKWKLIRNLFIVWFLTGIWHGANWTFIVWGLYFGTFILIEKIYKLDYYLIKYKVVGHMYTLAVVLFGWIIFRSESVPYALTYMKSMFGLNQNILVGSLAKLYVLENALLLMIGALLCFPIKKWTTKRKWVKQLTASPLALMGLSLIFVIAVAYLVKGSYNPFIYFNF